MSYGIGGGVTQLDFQEEILNVQEGNSTAFISESLVKVDYPRSITGQQYKPQVIVTSVLDTEVEVSGLEVLIESSVSFGGNYNTIGVVAQDVEGKWSNQSTRNGYRSNDGSNTYCIYSELFQTWILVLADVDHNNIGETVGGDPTVIVNDGQLPSSYGEYIITNNLLTLGSESFSIAESSITHYNTPAGSNSYFTVDFGTEKPAGLISYK